MNDRLALALNALCESAYGLVLIGVLSSIFILYWKVNTTIPRKATAQQSHCPLDAASFHSRLFFNWASPLLKTGYTKGINAEDLWDLCDEDSTTHAYAGFCTQRNKTHFKTPRSIWIGLLHAFGASYLWAGLLKAAADLLSIVQPQAFRILISFILDYNSDNGQSKTYGFVLAFSIFILLVFQTICDNQYEFMIMRTALRTQSALTMIIYDKTTKLSSNARSSSPPGTIINYIAVDVERLKNLAPFGHLLWSTPLKIGLALYSLHQLVGASAFIGFATLIGIIPLNTFVAKRLQGVSVEQRHNRDASTKMLTEMLMHIKNIKLLGWITLFIEKLETVRNDRELSTLKKQGISLAFADMVWNIGPFMVSFLSLTAYAVTQNNALRPEVAFPALTLLNLLNQPLAGFPYAVSAALHAIDSVKRIAKFQQEDEVEPKSIDRKLLLAEDKESVTIKDVAFAWSKPAEPNIAIKYLALYRRTLCCIIGSVGAGKSTLMEALLGGVSKSQGGVEIRGNVAYVAQVPWIFNGSIKENILFGYELNPKFYDIVLEACALKDDLTMLTNGDETQVGGQGMNLSGGQKARVALARAVYARADIYLLDDVLSAVDMHVKTHLIRNVLGPQGLLRDTTRIMTTNTLSILNESDHIIMLENGSVVESGLFENIHTGQGPIAHFLQAHAWSAEDESAQGSTDNTTKEPLMPPSIVSNPIKPAKLATRQLPKRKSSSDRPQVSTKVNLPALTTRSYKTNNWKLYEIYVRASSFSGILLFVLALFAHRLCAASTDVWVKVWLEANVNPGGRYNGWLYIGTYFALGLGAAVCSGTQMYSLLVHCSFQASKNLHAKMSHAVFHSPMTFFETTAFGDILTHFSSDMYRVDDRIARFFNSMLSTRIRTAMMLLIMAWTIPKILLVAIPLSVFYLRVQNYFINTSRELNNLDSKSSSLAYTHLQNVYAGISTIRAFRHLGRFQHEMERLIDRNQQAYFATMTVDYWLSIRLELFGAVLTAGIACFAVLAADSRSGISAALIGVVLVNAQRITSILKIQVQSIMYFEGYLVSLKRIIEYTELPIEGDKISSTDIPSAWPEHGAITFRNYSNRYREGLKEVLQNLNFSIKSGEKVGVVGRTGAGKSTLTLALFRIIEATQGYIEIDGIPISQIPLQVLRSRIANVPQDTSLFSGTIRSNLDPMFIYDDTKIWDVLGHVRLDSRIASLPEKLATKVEESGSNFSVGQRQLLSLARALLRNTSILVLDEATSSVDLETDRVLQDMLNGELLKDRTVITIAHRIETVLKSDRVLVLDHGEVVEFGPPLELMAKGELFYGLVTEAGLL